MNYCTPTCMSRRLLLTCKDVSGYPSKNGFFLCTTDDTAPHEVNVVLEKLQNFTTGSTIAELLALVSEKIANSLATGFEEQPFTLDDGTDGDAASDDEAEFWPDDNYGNAQPASSQRKKSNITASVAAKLKKQIALDLKVVRDAGFKIGILEGMKADTISNVLSLSIQVSRLCLSDEAVQAWDLKNDHYIVLLIRYSNGYLTFDEVLEMCARMAPIDFRVGTYRGVCNYPYKPTLEEALAAFTTISYGSQTQLAWDKPIDHDTSQRPLKRAGFQSIFVSSSLNEFMNGQFLSLLKIRWDRGFDWDTANRYLKDQGLQEQSSDRETVKQDYAAAAAQTSGRVLPEFLAADHMAGPANTNHSLPLIAMQFALRYLVRCTEFCLVCHCRTAETFEALKPYVCSNPLCLYQYMSLGFGPSIEHEILTQPYVVDLLISFCYASAKAHRFREFPSGLSLCVPGLTNPPLALNPIVGKFAGIRGSVAAKADISTITAKKSEQKSFTVPLEVKFDAAYNEIILHQKEKLAIHRGEWLMLTIDGKYLKSSIIPCFHWLMVS